MRFADCLVKKMICVAWLIAFAFSSSALPESDTRTNRPFAEIIEKNYTTARAVFHSKPGEAEATWQFARACFDWADIVSDDDQRVEISGQGIEASRQLIARDPKNVAGHYYLAMNLGELARTKSLGALKIVSEMEQVFKTALELDSKFDFAGPDRNLGMLYHEAPGWPASVGNHKKARQHLERARELSPDYPENHVYLLEAYIKWGEKKAAQKGWKLFNDRTPEMKKKFSGERWAKDWLDWEKRLKKVQEKMD